MVCADKLRELINHLASPLLALEFGRHIASYMPCREQHLLIDSLRSLAPVLLNNTNNLIELLFLVGNHTLFHRAHSWVAAIIFCYLFTKIVFFGEIFSHFAKHRWFYY